MRDPDGYIIEVGQTTGGLKDINLDKDRRTDNLPLFSLITETTSTILTSFVSHNSRYTDFCIIIAQT